MADDTSSDMSLTWFRYGVIAPLLAPEPGKTLKERIDEQASRLWTLPDGRVKSIGFGTIEKWLYDYRQGGVDALKTRRRSDAGAFRGLDGDVAAAIDTLLAEHPKLRSHAVIDHLDSRGLLGSPPPSQSTLYRYIKSRRAVRENEADSVERRSFEAPYAGYLWQADIMYGPHLPVRLPNGRTRKQPTYLIAVLTGPPGCGKTALTHYLCRNLNDNHHRPVHIPFSFLEKGHLAHYLAARLGLAPPRGIAATVRAVQEHLHAIQPVNPVIVLDEAERLETATVHLLRCLLDDRADAAHHCTLVLAGTDSFVDRKLRLHIHEPLRQRITLYLRLAPLGRNETGEYIAHHLRAAGSREDIFEPPAVELVHELASGVPRTIGALAETAMDRAAGRRSASVALADVADAAEIVLPPTNMQVNP